MSREPDWLTDLGDAWLSGLPVWWEPPARTEVLPPMTPAEETDGVPARHLVPDPTPARGRPDVS